jgi:hypothetical protein
MTTITLPQILSLTFKLVKRGVLYMMLSRAKRESHKTSDHKANIAQTAQTKRDDEFACMSQLNMSTDLRVSRLEMSEPIELGTRTESLVVDSHDDQRLNVSGSFFALTILLQPSAPVICLESPDLSDEVDVAAAAVPAAEVAASEVAAAEVAAAKVAVSEVAAVKVAASEVAASEVAASEVAAAKVAAAEVAAAKVAAFEVAMAEIAAADTEVSAANADEAAAAIADQEHQASSLKHKTFSVDSDALHSVHLRSERSTSAGAATATDACTAAAVYDDGTDKFTLAKRIVEQNMTIDTAEQRLVAAQAQLSARAAEVNELKRQMAASLMTSSNVRACGGSGGGMQ